MFPKDVKFIKNLSFEMEFLRYFFQLWRSEWAILLNAQTMDLQTLDLVGFAEYIAGVNLKMVTLIFLAFGIERLTAPVL